MGLLRCALGRLEPDPSRAASSAQSRQVSKKQVKSVVGRRAILKTILGGLEVDLLIPQGTGRKVAGFVDVEMAKLEPIAAFEVVPQSFKMRMEKVFDVLSLPTSKVILPVI